MLEVRTMSRNKDKEVPKDHFEAALDWETSRVLTIEKSERRAWLIAVIAVMMVFVLIVGIALMLPLKETVPYVVRVDNATGIPDIMTALTDKQVSGDVVMDKYWLAKFVRAREGYDWYTLQNDYNLVGLLSSGNVGREYAAIFQGKNSLEKIYGKKVVVKVDIVSVTPASANSHVATIRYVKTVKRVDSLHKPGTITKWVATLAYEYQETALIKESVRLINPFGFQVLSWRVDPEMSGSK
jgi:type IV secretory pathway component VirB8